MDYYISKNNGQYSGPFKKEQLINNGLDLNDLVWRQGLAAWMPANQLPELIDIINDVPPPMEMVLSPDVPTSASSPFVGTTPVSSTVRVSESMTNPNSSPYKIEGVEPKRELKKPVSTLKEAKVSKDKALTTAKTTQATTTSPKKNDNKVATNNKEKPKAKAKEKKTKYNYPVADWRNESIWLLAFVAIHALIEVCSDKINYTYLYLDIIGAALSITGIVIGIQIRKLNKTSYEKNSQSRLKAEKLGYFNGIFVSATAAIGFLVVLVQSAYYVYTC